MSEVQVVECGSLFQACHDAPPCLFFCFHIMCFRHSFLPQLQVVSLASVTFDLFPDVCFNRPTRFTWEQPPVPWLAPASFREE